MADELVELVERQVRLAPDVPELEAGVVVTRILVVDQPEAVADVDEVLGEKVVVARHGALVPDGHRLLDSPHLRLVVEVAVGKAEAALLDDAEVALLDTEHVEVVAEPACCVQLPARGGDPVEPVAAAKVLRSLRPALDELEHEDAALRKVGDDRRTDARFRGGNRVQILVLAVDGEQTRVLCGHTDDECTGVRLDLVVRIREASGELGHRVRIRQLGDELEGYIDLGTFAGHRGVGFYRMAWQLASFSADLLPAELEVEGAEVEIVPPGSQVRVTHVLDAIEPRIRPDGRAAFPSDARAGEGRTNRLDGVVVLSCLDFPGEERPLHEQESIVDLGGPGAALTPFAGMTAVVLTFSPGEGGHVEIDARARRTALSVAEEIARGTLDAEPEEIERFELGPAEESLPAVAALIQVSDLGALYIQYVYGRPAGEAGLPRAVDPAEVLDGAVTCGEYHWAAMRNPTWFFQRNELIRTLYREHGKTLRFAGVVLMRGYEQSAADKQRAAERAATVAGELGADGVVITTDAGGNSHTDVMLTCRACEQADIRTTVVLAEETDPQSTRPILTDWVREADSIVSTGNVEELVEAWAPERVLGGDHLLDGTLAAQAGSIPVRNYLGAANQMGQLALGARTE